MIPRQIIGDRSRMSMRKNAQNENVKYIVKFNQKNTRPSTMSLFKGIDRSKIKQINRSQVLDHRVPVFLIVGSERSMVCYIYNGGSGHRKQSIRLPYRCVARFDVWRAGRGEYQIQIFS